MIWVFLESRAGPDFLYTEFIFSEAFLAFPSQSCPDVKDR